MRFFDTEGLHLTPDEQVKAEQRAENERLDAAVDVVARRVIAGAVCAAEVAEDWENYPEVGEDDWRAIVDRALYLIAESDPAEPDYQDAYDLLARRAEDNWA